MHRANSQRTGNTFTERAEPNTAVLRRCRKKKRVNSCKSDIGMAAVDLAFKAEETD